MGSEALAPPSHCRWTFGHRYVAVELTRVKHARVAGSAACQRQFSHYSRLERSIAVNGFIKIHHFCFLPPPPPLLML
jgi:hypothetical protein